MKQFLSPILKPLSSLRLTVTLLALAMLLVFAGTWAQIDQGIWDVQQKYFHSFFCVIDFHLFLPRTTPDYSQMSAVSAAMARTMIAIFSHIRLPMIGGYTLIILLLVNLLSAHTLRFKFGWLDWLIIPEVALIIGLAWPFYSIGFYLMIGAIIVGAIPLIAHSSILHPGRTGIILIHLGLILLICGEVVTSLFQVEQQMVIDEGQTVSYASDIRHPEIVVIDHSPADHDNITAIPTARLERAESDDGSLVNYPGLPFEVHIDKYFPNSTVLGPMQAKSMGREDARATAGPGVGITAIGLARYSGTEAEKMDAPSAYVTLSANGQSLGTYLLSVLEDEKFLPHLSEPQAVKVGDKTYYIQLRFKRVYKPYSIQLIKFSYDRFTGIDLDRNFSSRVRLIDPAHGQDREVLIWMNHPLRYLGETFYQQSFNKAETGTVLQVVRNPGWVVPYVSCVLVGLGMLIHFGSNLSLFLRRRPAPRIEVGALWPGLIAAACVGIAVSTALTMGGKPAADSRQFDFSSAAQIPVSYEGRVMPIDSLARNSLRIISGHSYVTTDTKEQIPPVQWLLDVQAREERADGYKIFRIDYPDILDLLGVDHTETRFSFNQILAARDKLEPQLGKLQGLDPKQYDGFQKHLADLWEHIHLYLTLKQVENLYLAPPLEADQKWQTVEEVSHGKIEQANLNPAVRSLLQLLGSYHQNDAASFNDTARDYITFLKPKLPVMNRVQYEAFFNWVQPFTIAITLYVSILLLVFFSWIGWSPVLTRTAMWVLIATLVIHGFGLASRIYISGRPPVTNLYSASLFIAFIAALMCLGLELIFRNGMGSIAAAVIGFCSLIIAENLAVASDGGDTMHQLRAVLDTNFWLATHVVCITMGYAATFLAGMLAIVYVIRGVFTRSLASDNGKEMYRMVYGIVCFAMLFSFVGTVLGGIWADQSWGRFWGWDPKENGAVLIVIWNAMILHARWGGLAKARGVMSMAIFGNVVTAWSFFGTNMLGVGLHSYGFMDKALFWLLAFVIIQLALILVSITPLGWWRSFSAHRA